MIASNARISPTDSMQNYLDLLTDLELEDLLRLILPIVKLEAGKYLIGTKIR